MSQSMASEDQVELKPCPFCGNAPQKTKHKRLGDFAWSIECYEMKCRVQPTTHLYADYALALTAWNTRAALSAAQGSELTDAIHVLVTAYTRDDHRVGYVVDTSPLYGLGRYTQAAVVRAWAVFHQHVHAPVDPTPAEEA